MSDIIARVFQLIRSASLYLWRSLHHVCSSALHKLLFCFRSAVQTAREIMTESLELLYDDTGEDAESVSCCVKLGCCLKWLFTSFVNFMYWCCCCWCCRGLLRICGHKPKAVSKVSIVEHDPKKSLTGDFCSLYSGKVKFSIDEMDAVTYRKVLFVLHHKQVLNWMTSYGSNGNESPLALLEQFSRDKAGADIMVAYAGLRRRFITWPWKLCTVSHRTLDNSSIYNLIERKRFITLCEGSRLNPVQYRRFLSWTNEVALLPFTVVGFNSKTRDNVMRMLSDQINPVSRITGMEGVHLSKDDDFKPAELQKKVLMLCAYTERDNIMVERPDVGELTGVYEVAQEKNMDVLVMYAGVIPDKAHLSNNDLFAPNFVRLLKSQPRLRGLMDDRRFLTVSNRYRLNPTQLQRVVEWLTPAETL